MDIIKYIFNFMGIKRYKYRKCNNCDRIIKTICTEELYVCSFSCAQSEFCKITPNTNKNIK